MGILFIVTLVFIAVMLVYLSNKQQRWLTKPLNRRVRFASLSALVIAFVVSLQHFTLSASIVLITLLLMLAAMLLPLLSLSKRTHSR